MTVADPKIETALSSIQPLRDLARNWDVDIASCLEDYLQEIASVVQEEQAHVSSDATNFAQAALLLHNSSNVYSRKVEYLYTLVYAALDNLNSQHATKNKQNSSRKADTEIDEFEQFDTHLEFLLLDDVIPIGEGKIDLPFTGLHHVDASGFLPSTTRLSLGMSGTIDRSTAGVKQSAVLTTLTNSCGVLPQTDGNSMGMFYMRGTNDIQAPKSRLSSVDTVKNISCDDLIMQQEEGDDAGNCFDNDDDDHDNDGTGFELAGSMDQSVPEPRKPSSRRQPKKPHSAWDLLDPHDPEQVKGRPLRMGTTYLLPEGLSEPPSQFVTGARTKKHAVKEQQRRIIADERQHVCIATATFKATMANEQRRRDGLPDNDGMMTHDVVAERPIVQIQGLAFGGEFAYIAKAATKRKAAERREKRKLLQKEPGAIPRIEADNILGYDDDNDYGGGDDDSYGDDNGNNGGFQVFSESPSNVRDVTSSADGATFEELCRAHIQAFAKGAEMYRAETNLNKRVGDWQSKLSPILEDEAQRPEFDIHVYGEHVIESIQKNAGKQVSTKGDNKNHKAFFSSLTQAKKQYDVCRLFLASLSLVNSGNVQFNAKEGEVMRPETLVIELLNSNVDQPMESFLAPSAMEVKTITP